MDRLVILAHGALGVWDEVIFISVAAIFLVVMGISWIRSRSAPLDEPDQPTDDTPDISSDRRDDRFRLE